MNMRQQLETKLNKLTKVIIKKKVDITVPPDFLAIIMVAEF
jgi:hypothetical protein